MSNIIAKVFHYYKKSRYIALFGGFERSSAVGSDGYGKKCMIVGKQYMYIGSECRFGDGSEFVCLDSHMGQQLQPKLTIGNHVRMTSRCRITCAGYVEIGNDVLFAPEVFITDHNHGIDPTIAGGYSPQPLIVKNVSIGDGVWLGQRVSVLPGVSIGKHCIIGAGSIVTHDIPDYCMAAGNPARIIKKWNAVENCWERVQ